MKRARRSQLHVRLTSTSSNTSDEHVFVVAWRPFPEPHRVLRSQSVTDTHHSTSFCTAVPNPRDTKKHDHVSKASATTKRIRLKAAADQGRARRVLATLIRWKRVSLAINPLVSSQRGSCR